MRVYSSKKKIAAFSLCHVQIIVVLAVDIPLAAELSNIAKDIGNLPTWTSKKKSCYLMHANHPPISLMIRIAFKYIIFKQFV